MASIRTAVEMNDLMSGPLMHITNALNMTVSAFEQMQRTANNSFDPTTLQAIRGEMTGANASMEEMRQRIESAGNQQSNFNNQLQTGGNFAGNLVNKLMGLAGVYATIRGIKKMLDFSDTMVQTTARLNLMNDGLQTTEELQRKIFASAERSRASYQTTADVVSKLGIQAGAAFSSNDELIAFAEQLNKDFVIAGTSATGIQSTMYNLTQAMSSGVLRGQDLKAVWDNTPQVVQKIADHLGVTTGEIREMAMEGELSAQVVKNAMLAAADETNAAFDQMPVTFAQVATSIKNQATMMFQPVLAKIASITSNEQFQGFVDGFVDGLALIALGTEAVLDGAGNVFMFFSDNWSMISPIIYGIVAALMVYALYLGIIQAQTLILKGIELAGVAVKVIQTVATWLLTSATLAQAGAQHRLNAAMYASPVVWIIGIIIVLITVFYAAIATVNHFAGKSISATGLITGALAVAVAVIRNLLMGILELALGVINGLADHFVAFANFFGNVFNNPVSSIIYLFADLADAALGVLEKIASAMDFVFGSNMAATVAGWRSSVKEMADFAVSEFAPNENYTKVMDSMDLSVEGLGLKRAEYGNAWDTGYEFGQGIDDKISNFDPSSLIPGLNTDAYGGGSDFGGITDGVADTAYNTGKMKDSLEISGEDLKYLRDLAEMEVVNRFTTAEIKIEMTNHNNVNSDMDLDGMVDQLTSKMNEAMERSAEGVHV